MADRTEERSGELAGRRVLVVEDEFYIAADLSDALADMGAAVLGPVPTREEAEALIEREERVDLALLDINLQGEMVNPLADRLAARGIPFIFATGYDERAVPARFRDVPRWEKPFDPVRLAAALPGLLGRA